METAIEIPDLDSERIFIQTHTHDAAAILGNQAHLEETLGNNGFRVEDGGAQPGGAAASADLREFWPETAAFAGDDVALGAIALGFVNVLTTLGIAGDSLHRQASERTNVSCDLPDFTAGD